MNAIASISALLFIPLAAIFGANLRQGRHDLVWLMLSILLLVALTSLVLGMIFGRTALLPTTIGGGLALLLLWLPQQMYATEDSLIRSAIALLLVTFTQMPLFLVGSIARSWIAARLGNDDIHPLTAVGSAQKTKFPEKS